MIEIGIFVAGLIIGYRSRVKLSSFTIFRNFKERKKNEK